MDLLPSGFIDCALGLAGMELAFIIAALMVLCFGLVAKTVLLMDQDFAVA